MIETPTTAPPPDATTRVIDAPPRAADRLGALPLPPPDVATLHDYPCRECGSPLGTDQAACLVCGTMVEDVSGRMGLRRAAVTSAAALLLLGGAVGAAIAGLPHGKRVPKNQLAHVFSKKPIPPATASPNGGPSGSTGGGGTTPLPGSTGDATAPPAVHTPSTTHTPKVHTGGAGSSPGTSGGTSGGGAPAPSTHNTPSGGSQARGHKDTGKKAKKHGQHHGGHHGSRLTLFTTGETPTSAGEYGSGSGSADNTIDSDTHTSWSTTATGSGVWVQSNGSAHRNLGVVSPTPGYGASVYWSNAGSPPAALSDWNPASSTSDAGRKQSFALSGHDARNAKWYLVVVSDLPPKGRAKLAEIQLIP